MKIAWFSPLAPDHSEIANHTGRLVDDLTAKHEVRFLTERPDGFAEPASGRHYAASVGHISAELMLALNEVDLPIYNLGNHPEFFAKTWFLSQFKPGIVILHDLKLHHFYAGIYHLQLKDMPGYLAPLREYHGRLGHEAGMAYWQQKLSVDFMAQHFPMTQWAIRNALAVVIHTEHARQVVSRLTRTPVRMISLAHTPQTAERAARAVGELETDGCFTQERRVRLILFGYLNINRRIVEFLTALAAMPERERFEVQLMGTVRNRLEVENAVESLRLRGKVTLYGHVPEEQLVAALSRADLAINLRYPTMGEASASQLRIWDHALPSLVTCSEGYAALPPEAVFFVHPETERADIQQHLRQFLQDPAAFDRAGQKGRQWLLQNHLPSMYVAQLDDLIVQMDALRSRHNQLTLADRVGTVSARWINLVPLTSREPFYAARISELV